jgi:hypothetical protein
MWTPRSERLADGRGIRVVIDLDSSPVTYAEVLRRWQTDAVFRSLFLGLLADAPFAAFRWETPPLTKATASRPFEFVLLDSPWLAGPPDTDAFAEHFRSGDQGGVVAFPNLGKDALLIVPCPNGPLSAYGHLAAFVREAPDPQRHALWKAVGAAMERRLAPGAFGSAQLGRASPGCTCGSMIGPSTTAMRRIGRAHKTPDYSGLRSVVASARCRVGRVFETHRARAGSWWVSLRSTHPTAACKPL